MPADDISRMRITSLFQKSITMIKISFIEIHSSSKLKLAVSLYSSHLHVRSCYFNIRPAKRILDPRNIVIKLIWILFAFIFSFTVRVQTEIQCRQLTGIRLGFIHCKRFLNHCNGKSGQPDKRSEVGCVCVAS